MSQELDEQSLMEWRDVRESLQEVDTDYITDQLDVMYSAELMYTDGITTDWHREMSDRYETLIRAFGGEESVNQYLDVGAKGVSIAVEQGEEPLFVVYAKERPYEEFSGPKIDFDTAV